MKGQQDNVEAQQEKDITDQSLGEFIRKERIKKELTQKDLADALDTTAGFITKLESGETALSAARCDLLADKLGVPFEQLWELVKKKHTQNLQRRARASEERVANRVATNEASNDSMAPSANGIRDYSAEREWRKADTKLKLIFSKGKPSIRESVNAMLDVFVRQVAKEGTTDS